MHWESIAALGLHSRELSVRSATWPSDSLVDDSPAPAVKLDAVTDGADAGERSGATATAAFGAAKALATPATGKCFAM
jgi:hypothetical protein